jgi:hypothetical protein
VSRFGSQYPSCRGHHIQKFLEVQSDFPNSDLPKVFAYKIKRIQSCINGRGHLCQLILLSAQRLSERTVVSIHNWGVSPENQNGSPSSGTGELGLGYYGEGRGKRVVL